jgi:uncharacterized membrane protein YjfL (UPF0719 family)
MEKHYEFAWQSGLFLVACLCLFFIAKQVFRLFNPKININDELTKEDNLAFYIGYIGYYIAILMVIGGVMLSEGSGDFWEELGLSAAYGVAGMLVLNIASIVMDKVAHPKRSLTNEIVEKKSVAAGILKGANYLITGIIIGGIMLTEVDKPLHAAAFLGLALLVASIGIVYYNIITPFNVKEQIYKGNVAVACSTAGAQIAFAILIHSGFQIEHASWQESLMLISIDVLGGFLILPLIRFVVDKVFLPGRKLTDELVNQETPNLGAGLFEAFAYVSGAMLFVWCWTL